MIVRHHAHGTIFQMSAFAPIFVIFPVSLTVLADAEPKHEALYFLLRY